MTVINKYAINSIDDLKARTSDRIGLALSGGGFRASLFHLGVIRRLEELGIMQDVSVLSGISGGSIIAAFYSMEMEQRLRKRRREIEEIWNTAGEPSPNAKKRNQEINRIKLQIARIRLEIFEEIAEKFFIAMDKNMRMRATLFAPIYHLKGLWAIVSRNYTRAELIQLEYDKWLYHDGVVDFLPSYHIVSEDDFEKARKNQDGYQLDPGYHVYNVNEIINGQPVVKARAQHGTKVIITATSLLTGTNKSFYRVPIWGLSEMTKTNENVERISKVVGASSAVPGAFPPAVIGGDVFADGGISDNQGLHVFIAEEQNRSHYTAPTELHEEVDVLLVSDASGQMLKVDQLKRTEVPVLVRTQGIQSFELRNKNIDLLINWRRVKDEKRKNGSKEKKNDRLFAFVQLYRSLKDREEFVGRNRVPSEYVSALGRIRTDLDQFSHIEREALMYHGYTLIDNQLREWCGPFLNDRGLDYAVDSKNLNERLCGEEENKDCQIQMLRRPPLFQEAILFAADNPFIRLKTLKDYRKKIQRHLEAGKSMLLSSRLNTDHKLIVFLFYLASIFGIWAVFRWIIPLIQTTLGKFLITYLTSLLNSIIPPWLHKLLDSWQSAGYIAWPIITPQGMSFLATLLLVAIGVYIIFGLLFRLVVQPVSIRLDKDFYRFLTGKRIARGNQAQWDLASRNDERLDDLQEILPYGKKSYQWPEAIDVDKNGNIYFTDSRKKALYRIERESADQTLHSRAKKLVVRFPHIAGISIDKENEILYIGSRSGRFPWSKWAIFELPLDRSKLERYAVSPKKFKDLKISLKVYKIAGKPNGLLFVPGKDGGQVFYTRAHIFGKKGFLGSIMVGKQGSQKKEIDPMVTPNGLALDTSGGTSALLISQSRKNAVTRLTLPGKKQETHTITGYFARFGAIPDGLICLEDGGILVTTFLRGEILYLSFDKGSYSKPVVIARQLRNPTDLVIAASSTGNDESLFVTCASVPRLFSAWGGRVVEIPGIGNKIANAKSMLAYKKAAPKPEGLPKNQPARPGR